MAREVTCITKGDPDFDDCRCITMIGYVDDLTGRTRRAPPERVYEHIVEQGITYYITFDGGRKAQLLAVNDESRKYVRTERNREAPTDHLLKQPAC